VVNYCRHKTYIQIQRVYTAMNWRDQCGQQMRIYMQYTPAQFYDYTETWHRSMRRSKVKIASSFYLSSKAD